MRSFRVVTFNIWNRMGPWEQRLPAIRSGLRALAPDVLGLQEVLRPAPGVDGPDQAAEIAGDAFHIAWGTAQDEPVRMGNAVLSRWPILRSETFPLPQVGTDERRCLVFAELDAPFGKLPVFVTHLNWKLHEGHVREHQVRFVADHVRMLAPIGGFPPVLLGDFNAEPESDEIRFLRGLTSLGGRSVYFADCFALAGDGSAGVTYSPATNPFAAPTYEPERRIDYVFVRGPDSRGRGRPIAARVCFDEPNRDHDTAGVFPSDHYGVLAEISAVPALAEQP
jgi:endonuclease/exonuclease/phosphatase family metal-dependent hydrolase